MMTHLTLIVPFSVPPGAADDAADDVVPGALLRQLELPALGKLLTRATPGPRERHGADFDPTALRSLPHERWLAGRAGLGPAPGSPLASGQVPSAPYMRLADLNGRPAGDPDAAWACLQPVHIHAARDHLVLMDPAALAPDAAEAAALADSLHELLGEAGLRLDTLAPGRWYIPASAFGPIDATPPLRATGRNIDIWLQAGPRARDWRRFQNEIQMTWHDHPVNQAREADGRPTVNSVWLYGEGVLRDVPRLADTVWSDDAFLTGLGLAGGATALPAPPRFDADAADGSALALLDGAAQAHIGQDWGLWIERMQALDASWFGPALAALEAGRLQAVTLVLSADNHFAEFTVGRGDLRKFWRGLGARGDWRVLLSNLAMAN